MYIPKQEGEIQFEWIPREKQIHMENSFVPISRSRSLETV